MAKQYGSQRKRSGAPLPIVALGILVVGLVGGALILHALGVVQIPLLTKKVEAAKGPLVLRPGQVARVQTPQGPIEWVGVPRAAVPISAYEQVATSHVLDPKTRGVATIPMMKEDAERGGVLLHTTDIVGRVLRFAKGAGYVFTEADFYPPGTRPGPTAGVPPGKRAMRLKANEVPGLHGLKQGDRFDLVMTQTLEVEKDPVRATPRAEGRLDVEGPYAKLHEAETTAEAQPPRVRVKRQHAEVRTIVNNGIVVQPVMQREEIGSSVSLLRGSRLTATPVEEIIIAVAPEEVAEVNMALALKAQLQVAMRSGQAGANEGDDTRIPDIEVVFEEEQTTTPNGNTVPTGTTKIVEVIKGVNKKLQAVPKDDADTRE